MLKPQDGMDLSQAQQTQQPQVTAPEVLSFFETIFRNDIRFRIIMILSNREGAGLREIARNAGISHKNLLKYLEILAEKRIIEVYPVGIKNKVYKLSTKYDYMRYYL
jgi:predicted transcriptional regulator